MRIAIYVRVSTQRQAQTKTIEQQIERLTDRDAACPRQNARRYQPASVRALASGRTGAAFRATTCASCWHSTDHPQL
jgi:DNA invertase Pin-like site-specific DNA recombinase